MRLTKKQRETLEEAVENGGRIVTKGRRSPHHERLTERGLLVRKGMTRMPIQEYRCTSISRGDYAWRTCWYRAVDWRITPAGREAVR